MYRRIKPYLPSRQHAHDWLDRHPVVAAVLERTGCLHVHRRTLARGVAVGLFVGLTPTIGLQTLLMLAGCALVRGNFPAAFIVSWVSNPVTVAPLYFAFNRLGEAVFGRLLEPAPAVTDASGEAAAGALYLALGSLMIATPVALASYAVFIWISRLLVIRRRNILLRHRRRP